MIDYYHYYLSRHNNFYGVYDVYYHLWMMMMIITLQDREVLATVGSLQHPSPGKPEVWLDVEGDE